MSTDKLTASASPTAVTRAAYAERFGEKEAAKQDKRLLKNGETWGQEHRPTAAAPNRVTTAKRISDYLTYESANAYAQRFEAAGVSAQVEEVNRNLDTYRLCVQGGRVANSIEMAERMLGRLTGATA